MPEDSISERLRKRFDARKSEIKKEYEIKLERLEKERDAKIAERDAKIAESNRRFRKEFCVALKEVVLKNGDYEWLLQWLEKTKENEAQEAENKLEKEKAEKLRAMSAEDYLFRYLKDPQVVERTKALVAGKPEDIERFLSIESKLKYESTWLDGTLL